MIRRFIIIATFFSSLNVFSYDNVMFKNLHSRYVRNFSKKNNQIIENHALQALLKISKISSLVELESILTNPVIKNLFSSEIENQQENDELYYNVLGVRYLVLLYLYDQMFQRYIASTETFLNNLLDSQKYWLYENFYMKQSWLNRNVLYNFYSSQYDRTVNKKIVFLHDIEQQVAYMLGVCLYGIAQIEKISTEDQIANHTAQFVELFYQAYNMPTTDKESQKDPIKLYQDLIWINANLEQHMKQAKELLDEHNKPSFIQEHAVFVASVTATLVAMVIWSKQHEHDIPVWWEKLKSMKSTFYRDYFINPVYKIVDNVWYNKATKIPKISLERKIDKISLIDQKPIGHVAFIEHKPIAHVPLIQHKLIAHVPLIEHKSIAHVSEFNAKFPIQENDEKTKKIGIGNTYATSILLGEKTIGTVDTMVKDVYQLTDDGKKVWNGLVDGVNKTINEGVNPVIDTTNSVVEGVNKTIKDGVNHGIDTANSVVDGVNKTIKDGVNPGIDTANSVVGVTNAMIKDAVNPTIDKVNSGVEVANKAIGAVNSVIDNIDATVDSINDVSEKIINPVIETAELTLYMVMIGVSILGGYLIYSGTKKAYNHYIKHENWYVPMRYIIRSIDQLLNKITRADDSPDFAQNGKMYMLIQHLKEYISCLKDEELFLMNNDINELLSFDLNYHQKRGIVQRMYKTYAFLK